MGLPAAPLHVAPMPGPAVLAGARPGFERRSRGFVPGSPMRRWDDRLDLTGGLALRYAAPVAVAVAVPTSPVALPLPRRVVVDETPAIGIAAVALAVGIAQAADLMTFVRMVLTVGAHAEANPLVRTAIGTVGVEGLIVAKIALVAFVVATFAFVYRYHRWVAALVATVGTAAGLIGAFSNLMTLA